MCEVVIMLFMSLYQVSQDDYKLLKQLSCNKSVELKNLVEVVNKPFTSFVRSIRSPSDFKQKR